MADATPLDARAPRRRRIGKYAVAAALSLSSLIAPAIAEDARYGAIVVTRAAAPEVVRLTWRSRDARFEIALVDNGVALRSVLRGLDTSGVARCTGDGPLLAYDSADWMELRWRTLIEEQGNFLRTCHVIPQRGIGKYRGQFLHDAASFGPAIGEMKHLARDAFGPGRARCMDFRDGSDAATADRSKCEQMVER